MQGRHRSPVDGLRSAGAGRLPKEVHGGYGGSGYRNFGRGGKYRRGPPPKPSHSYLPPPPPPPPRKIDIMMEAGRLAAEYFVSKGVIPASLLPPKWPSDSVSQDSKGRDKDNSSFHGRTSALDRIGNSNYDSGYGRRRYNDERDHGGQGTPTRGRKKREGNHNRSHGSDWGRDERNGSWADNRSRYPNENGAEDDDTAAPGYRRSGGYDYYSSSRTFKSVADSEPRSEESEMDNYDGGDDTGSKASSSSTRKDPLPDVDAELMRGMSEGDTLNMEAGNTRGNENTEQEDKDRMDEDSPEQHLIDEVGSSEHAADLLKLCSFTKVPTKPRSSVINRSPKAEEFRVSAVPENIAESSTSPEKDEIPSVVWVSNTEPSIIQTADTNVAPSQDDSMLTEKNASQDDSMPSEKNVSQVCLGEPASVPMSNTAHLGPQDSAALPLSSVEEGAKSDAVHTTENRSCTRSISFPEKFSTPLQRDLTPALVLSSENRNCARSFSFSETSSIALIPEEADKSLSNRKISAVPTDAAAGDGLALQSGQIGGTKRPREWYSDIVSSNEYGLMRNLRAKQSGSQDKGLLPHEGLGFEQKKSTTTAALFHKGEPGCQVNMEEDRRSNSFKICDLNLMEAPEITEITDDPVIDAGTSVAVKTEKVNSVDFGLSISNNPQSSDMYSQHSNDDKGITIIDLEDDSPAEDGVWDPSKHKSEPMYPNLDNFLNNTVSTVDLPDIPDGYSLAISDLLGADIAGCPSVSADMNNLHPGMTLPGSEGMPADDDSIYVSLGEIPIGFMDVWDPPPQEYGKFF